MHEYDRNLASGLVIDGCDSVLVQICRCSVCVSKCECGLIIASVESHLSMSVAEEWLSPDDGQHKSFASYIILDLS